MCMAMNFIQNMLDPMDTAQRAEFSPEVFAAVRDADLWILVKLHILP